MDSFSMYMVPTQLCDFDNAPKISSIAQELAAGLIDRRAVVDRIYKFIKGLPYFLEDWDVKASATLASGKGMCCGKSNLMVAMTRSLDIPARYIVMRVEPEGALWRWIGEQDSVLGRELGEPASIRDHVVAEAYIEGWERFDPSRDPAFEEGLRRIGIPLKDELINQKGNAAELFALSSIDEWAYKRQESRRFRETRGHIFSMLNQYFQMIRNLDRSVADPA